MAANTQTAYSELIRVGLTYSAIETYGRLTRGKDWKDHISLIDKDQADKLRESSFSKIHDMLSKNLEPAPRRKHANFRNGGTNDLVHFYSGLRHLVFHGHATAYGGGLPRSRDAIAVLRNTSILVLVRIDDYFTEYVHGLDLDTSNS